MAKFQLLSLFHEEVPVGLRETETETEEVSEVLSAWNNMKQYCQKHERMYQMLHWMFADSIASTG